MVRFAEAWSEYLPENHRDALYSALCILSDEFIEDDIEDNGHIFRDLLPSKYLYRYTSGFINRFYATLLTVGYKLALPDNSHTLLSCTAEELALNMLIERASDILEDEGIEAEFGGFEDVIFQDVDFEYLYEPENDGIEDSAIGKEIGMGYLHFSDWFKPFDNTSMPVHPFCWEKNDNVGDNV